MCLNSSDQAPYSLPACIEGSSNSSCSDRRANPRYWSHTKISHTTRARDSDSQEQLTTEFRDVLGFFSRESRTQPNRRRPRTFSKSERTPMRIPDPNSLSSQTINV